MTSDLSVRWKSFTDVEEEGNGVHHSGIMKYEVAIGKVFLFFLYLTLYQATKFWM